jgi:flavin reductase (DIM6/NTAB) family NADH-FMN oxidoreductase RutF
MDSRFADVPVHRQASQRLRLSGALAWFDCTLQQLVDAGDHHIVIGKVNDFGWRDAAALGFWRSQFGQFQAIPA